MGDMYKVYNDLIDACGDTSCDKYSCPFWNIAKYEGCCFKAMDIMPDNRPDYPYQWIKKEVE